MCDRDRPLTDEMIANTILDLLAGASDPVTYIQIIWATNLDLSTHTSRIHRVLRQLIYRGQVDPETFLTPSPENPMLTIATTTYRLALPAAKDGDRE